MSSAGPTRTARRSRVGKVALVGWFVVTAMLSAGLLARHLLAMPVPAPTARLAAHLAVLRPSASHGWLAVHVINAECRCSRSIVDHLLASARPPGWVEVVLWVGSGAPPPALSDRFDVRRLTMAELAALEIEAAPLLLVVSPEDEIRYVGGYTSRKQGPAIEDLEILADARARRPVEGLPLFGCPISERLRTALARLPSP